MTQPSPPMTVAARRLGSFALVLMLVAGCGAERDGSVRSATQPRVPASPSPSATHSTSAGHRAWTLIAPAKRNRFLADLKTINRAFVADREIALSHAVDVCYQTYDGKSSEAVRAYARQAYSDGGTIEVSSAAAAKIVTKIKKWICADGALYRRWES